MMPPRLFHKGRVGSCPSNRPLLHCELQKFTWESRNSEEEEDEDSVRRVECNRELETTLQAAREAAPSPGKQLAVKQRRPVNEEADGRRAAL